MCIPNSSIWNKTCIQCCKKLYKKIFFFLKNCPQTKNRNFPPSLPLWRVVLYKSIHFSTFCPTCWNPQIYTFFQCPLQILFIMMWVLNAVSYIASCLIDMFPTPTPQPHPGGSTGFPTTKRLKCMLGEVNYHKLCELNMPQSSIPQC